MDAERAAREILRRLFSSKTDPRSVLPNYDRFIPYKIDLGVDARRARRGSDQLTHGEFYPFVPFRFHVDVDSKKMGFSEVSGLETKMDTTEIVEGGENTFVHRVPGRVKYENLILKRGMYSLNSSAPLVAWCKLTLDTGVDIKIVPKTIIVSLLDETGKPIATWNFTKAYPVRWKVGDLNSTEDGNVLIEEIELCYQRFTRT